MFEDMKEAVSSSAVPDFRPEMAFPLLTEEMVETLRPYGTEERVAEGTILFDRGERQIDMWVVLKGSIEIYALGKDNQPELIHVTRERDFTGELNMLNAQRTLASGRVAEDSLLLRISRAEMRRMMRAEGEIANLIMQAVIWRRLGVISQSKGGVVLLGHQNEAETLLLQRFLVRNAYPHRMFEAMLDQALPIGTDGVQLTHASLPAVFMPDGKVFRRPAIATLADELGITEMPDPGIVYDVTVVGTGPSGLAAAVYAASEGLCTLAVEGIAPGGQAGTSSKIENYLGFPTGISGQRLAHRAQLQALKFGVRMAIARDVVSIDEFEGVHRLTLAGGFRFCTRAVVIASGAQYRKLSVKNYSRYENQGIYYAATAMESLLCRENEVIVVGGGNSAGQAAVFLGGIARHVHLIVRAGSLASTMSQYLISRIENSSRITLYTDTEIETLEGEPKLERVTWVNRKTGESTTKDIGSIFVMIGAEPNSGWLYGTLRLDKKGFVETGGSVGFESTPYATSVPGIYAVGDVRSNSVKRVASAVGEGSVVISDVHRYLANHHDMLPADPNSALAALQSANAAVNAH